DAAADPAANETPPELSSDPYDPQFYLQQIPVGEDEIAASDAIIADGLYNMAVIYKDGLNDANLALETFEQLNDRFPAHENRLQAYYHTYLIYLKEGDPVLADAYKQKIRTEFPDSEWAIAMADPNYEYNRRRMDIQIDSLYQDTYQAYLAGETERVRANYAQAERIAVASPLTPKFMFLNALSYVQARDAESVKAGLKSLIAQHPDADVSALASEIMKGFQRGLLLSASGDNLLARGGLFTILFGGSADEAAVADSIPFSPETDVPHQLLIIYSQGSVDDNLLLYTVASFNFGAFVQADFDLERTDMGNIRLLHIKGFDNLPEVMQYVQMIYAPEGYAPGLEPSIVILPVSLENYNILMRGKTLSSYMQFFEEQFGKENPQLIERWKAAQKHEQTDRAESVPETPVAPASSASVDTPLSPAPDADKTPDVLQVPGDTLPSAPTSDDLERRIAEQKTDEWTARTEDVLNQSARLADEVSHTLDEIAADPVRGIQKWFTRLFRKTPDNAIDEYAKTQEKERKALLKKQAEEEKALLKAKKKQEDELSKKKKQDDKAKAAEKQRLQQEKKAAEKQKEKERREAQKLKEKERKEKIRTNEAARKQREKERKQGKKTNR
ncbi:MAG: hypothetical protein LBB85_12045, partial [Dysgonamonadaceae bacterium]|nr:hypothetical protein [Dysgonamonadaceae bacterium]